jgi:alkyl sulfatase BDS1-like metallo-beta-lactamase superfamily hydrolase
MTITRRTLAQAAVATTALPATAQQQQQQRPFAPAAPAAGRPSAGQPTEATLRANDALRRTLSFDDTRDFEDARRGFVAALPDPVVIRGEGGRPVWDLQQYAFLGTNPQDDAPPTVNPSLWRNAKLNMIHGLFQVVDGSIWQVRGYDLSVMSIIRGDVGWIVVDPFVSAEVARTVWRDLVVPNLGQRPITAVIYTHSHIDHYGGVRGLVEEADVAAGRVKILAPEGFTEAAVAENVIAGNVMGRRASYMYGNLLPKGPSGQIDGGLGKTTSTGTPGLIVPTDLVRETGQKVMLDGVEMVCILAPDSEAPAEFLFFLPRQRALCAAEDATHTMHNLYTLRGAKFRDGLKWSKYLQQALDMFGAEMQVVFASHHWPTWDNERCRVFLSSQRDLFRYIHDQTLRMANQGMTPLEIGEQIKLPDSMDRVWSNRGYYGSLYHNARAQYGLYLGWFDGVPANLHPLPPTEAGKRYVEFMGGAEALLRRARTSYDQGEYRWVAEVVNHLVFAEPGNRAAKDLLADAYEQMGFQAESGPWRNFYLTGATELRRGVNRLPTPNTASPDTIRAMPMETFFDYLGVRLNGDRAAGKRIELNFVLTDTGERYVLGVENATLHYSADRQAERADATLTTPRAAFNDVMLGATTLEQQVIAGRAQVDGSASKLGEFISLLDTFEFWFPIVTPRT